MTKDERLQAIMKLKGIETLDVSVDFITDQPIRKRSFEDYGKVKEFREMCRKVIAEKLGVSPNVLKGCNTDDVVELMETLFWLEANGENDVFVGDGFVILEIPKLNPFLEEYSIMQDAAEKGDISNEAYLDWKLNWDKNSSAIV